MELNDEEIARLYTESITEGLLDRIAVRAGKLGRAPVKGLSRVANHILNQGLKPEDRDRVQANIKASAGYDNARQYFNRHVREMGADMVKLGILPEAAAKRFESELSEFFKQWFTTQFYGDQVGDISAPGSTAPSAPPTSQPQQGTAPEVPRQTLPPNVNPGVYGGITIHPDGTVEIIDAVRSGNMKRDLALYMNAVIRIGIPWQEWQPYLYSKGYTHEDIRNVTNTIKATQAVASHQAQQPTAPPPPNQVVRRAGTYAPKQSTSR